MLAQGAAQIESPRSRQGWPRHVDLRQRAQWAVPVYEVHMVLGITEEG